MFVLGRIATAANLTVKEIKCLRENSQCDKIEIHRNYDIL